jgi:hypothetical protein
VGHYKQFVSSSNIGVASKLRLSISADSSSGGNSWGFWKIQFGNVVIRMHPDGSAGPRYSPLTNNGHGFWIDGGDELAPTSIQLLVESTLPMLKTGTLTSTCSSVACPVGQQQVSQASSRECTAPILVALNARCKMSNAAPQKTLGDAMSIAECAVAVRADPFCGTRFHAHEGGSCFCIPVEVDCEPVQAQKLGIYDAPTRES